jgi:hypothetical protein
VQSFEGDRLIHSHRHLAIRGQQRASRNPKKGYLMQADLTVAGGGPGGSVTKSHGMESELRLAGDDMSPAYAVSTRLLGDRIFQADGAGRACL